MSINVSVQQFIKGTLIEQLGQILHLSPYLSFLLICSGIEFLGVCLDTDYTWTKEGKSEQHFKNGLKLFPCQYHGQDDTLYHELRCGLAHSQLPGHFMLTEVKNDTLGSLTYENHLISNRKLIVLDYFYFDFVQACLKVISTQFPKGDKMNKPFIYVGPVS